MCRSYGAVVEQQDIDVLELRGIVLSRNFTWALTPDDIATRPIDDRDGIDTPETHQKIPVGEHGYHIEAGPAIPGMQWTNDVDIGI